LDLRAQQ
jgi:catechol 2,3-dioxygenase-like lactoylglutathione lyase family enzyme